MAPSPGQRRTLPPSAVVLGQQAPDGGAAAAETIGNGLLRQASAAPALGALLARLAGPEQDQQGEQDQRQQQSGGSGERHGVVCLEYSRTVSQQSTGAVIL